MGKNTVRFTCCHCSHCCTDVVCLPTPHDVIQIVRSTGLHPKEFTEFLTPDEITGVPMSDPAWLRCGKQPYMMALKRDEKDGCYFLNKREQRCAIYHTRPILCRLFPFKLHETRNGRFKAFSLHGDVECPRQQGGQVATKPLYDLWREDAIYQQDYSDLVEVFNRTSTSATRPEAFLRLFVVEHPPRSEAPRSASGKTRRMG